MKTPSVLRLAGPLLAVLLAGYPPLEEQTDADQVQSGLASIRPRGLVAVYDPVVRAGGTDQRLRTYWRWNDPMDLSRELAQVIQRVSHGQVQYVIVNTGGAVDVTFSHLEAGHDANYDPASLLSILEATDPDARHGRGAGLDGAPRREHRVARVLGRATMAGLGGC